MNMQQRLYHAQMNTDRWIPNEIFFIRAETCTRIAYVDPTTWGVCWYDDLQINLSDVLYSPHHLTDKILAANLSIVLARMCHMSPAEKRSIHHHERGSK